MIELLLSPGATPPRTVLCLGAHCDDIEIGCGGTVLRLVEALPQIHWHWVVLSSTPARAAEARASAELFLKGAGAKRVVIQEFRNSFFPYTGAEIKEYFEQLKREVAPDVVFTHRRDDLHQDHRLTGELTWNSFRNHLVLEYEIPKYDGDLGAPNVFVSLDESYYQRKVDYLIQAFPTQQDKGWFTRETFLALMRLRGMESNAGSGYAEGFYGRKLCLGFA